MNAIKIGFCFCLGFVAYKSFNKEEIKILYRIVTEKIANLLPSFQNVFNNFNVLLSASEQYENITNIDVINKRIQKLNESIKAINEKEINEIKFKKIK